MMGRRSEVAKAAGVDLHPRWFSDLHLLANHTARVGKILKVREGGGKRRRGGREGEEGWEGEGYVGGWHIRIPHLGSHT